MFFCFWGCEMVECGNIVVDVGVVLCLFCIVQIICEEMCQFYFVGFIGLGKCFGQFVGIYYLIFDGELGLEVVKDFVMGKDGNQYDLVQ